MALQGISKYCEGLNLSGLQKVEYLPTDWVDASVYEQIITSTYNWQYNIVSTQGAWMLAPFLASPQLWSETPSRNKQGKYYNQKINGIIPNLRPEVTGEFEEMEEHCFLIRLTDRNGNKWILGTLEYPFEFKAGAKSGDGAGLNNYRIQFDCKTIKRARGFEPIFYI